MLKYKCRKDRPNSPKKLRLIQSFPPSKSDFQKMYVKERFTRLFEGFDRDLGLSTNTLLKFLPRHQRQNSFRDHFLKACANRVDLDGKAK